MLVQCITNDIDKLSSESVRKRLAESTHLDGGDADLVISNTYPVYAIENWSDGGLRVYLHTVIESDHPYPYPLEMFSVIDSLFPAHWCVSFEQRPSGMVVKQISFPEWVNDDHFYEKLVDGDEEAIAIYKLRRDN